MQHYRLLVTLIKGFSFNCSVSELRNVCILVEKDHDRTGKGQHCLITDLKTNLSFTQQVPNMWSLRADSEVLKFKDGTRFIFFPLVCQRTLMKPIKNTWHVQKVMTGGVRSYHIKDRRWKSCCFHKQRKQEGGNIIISRQTLLFQIGFDLFTCRNVDLSCLFSFTFITLSEMHLPAMKFK